MDISQLLTESINEVLYEANCETSSLSSQLLLEEMKGVTLVVSDNDLQDIEKIKVESGPQPAIPDRFGSIWFGNNAIRRSVCQKYIKNTRLVEAIDALDKLQQALGRFDGLWEIEQRLDLMIGSILEEKLTPVDLQKLRKFI